jgi:hypothetical protein
MVLAISGLFPLIIVGVATSWAPARYLFGAYPFILISSLYVLYVITGQVLRLFSIDTRTPAIVVTYTICLSGILGGHGLIPAYKAGSMDHGDILNTAALIFPFYPDHKSPGEFVSLKAKDEDVIVAEDALQQKWYAGRVDYWLRDSEFEKDFLYRGEDNQLHDIYVSSTLATIDILNSLLNDKTRNVWVITSGETVHNREYYLNAEQRQWLEFVEREYTPVFTGRDQITKVYCLNCPTKNPKTDPAP